MQAYSDPSRECGPTALPDIEVFHQTYMEFLKADSGTWLAERWQEIVGDGYGAIESVNRNVQAAHSLAGWYWWACFPGCLPEGDPNGPFETEADALADAQEGNDS